MIAVTALRALLSFVLPALAGWAVVATTWRDGSRLLKGILSVGVGLGLSGAVWMFVVMTSGSSRLSLVASESVLLFGLAALLILRFRGLPAKPTAVHQPAAKLGRIEKTVLIFTLLFAVLSAAMILDFSPDGDYDAVAVWNTRARFFYLSDHPTADLVDMVNSDYPVLLPSLVARGWQYSGRDTIFLPIALHVFFTAGSVLVLIGGLRFTAAGTAFLAGCAALSTPMFIFSGVSQYADILICFFITTAITLYLISDSTESGTRWLPFLSGLFAGFAACTKNEGTLFVLVMVGSRVCLLAWERRWRADASRLGLFLAGLIPGLASLAAFRALSHVKSPLFGNMTAATIATRLTDTPRHLAILQGFVRDLWHFGNWWITPFIPMILYVVIQRRSMQGAEFSKEWKFPASVLIVMLCAYYGVYLFSPYEVVWHVQTSFPRLLIQLWPTALILWALLTARSSAGLDGQNRRVRAIRD